MTNHATKHDAGKLRYDLIPPEILRALAEVYTFGAAKYGDNNWRKGLDHGRLYAATMRHLETDRSGEYLDPESGLPHLAHAFWNVGSMLFFKIQEPTPREAGCDCHVLISGQK